MIPLTSFAGRTLAVFGLGGSGLVSCHALIAGGAEVVACDDDPARMQAVADEGIPTADLRTIDWSPIAALVLAPGVPLTHPRPHWVVELARAHGKEIIGDVELFSRERRRVAPNAPFIAITGTNGKSTTTALTAHILRASGRDVQMGGNIGTAVLSLEPLTHERCYVVECSSYQIDLAPTLDPTVGILLNITEDHLDRHGTIEHYAEVKARLVGGAQVALIGVDDMLSSAIADALSDMHPGQVYPVSVRRELPRGFALRGTQIVFTGTPTSGFKMLANLAGVASLRGSHNAQNAAFACAAAWHCGLTPEEITRAVRTFPGLAHRMEELGHLGRVLYVNDSKATNADSAAKALVCFDEIYWIAGGKPKTGGIEALREFFPRVRKAYLIGEAAEEFARTLEGSVPYAMCGTLDVAVAAASRDAKASSHREPVVLLSPACASFDQYRNFEIRGEAFRKLVLDLPGLIPSR